MPSATLQKAPKHIALENDTSPTQLRATPAAEKLLKIEIKT